MRWAFPHPRVVPPLLLLLITTWRVSPAVKAAAYSTEEEMRLVPGKVTGEAKTYWLAPYVKFSEECIGSTHSKTVTWYAENGTIKTQRTVRDVQWNYASTLENGETTVLGINADWKLVLPLNFDERDPAATDFHRVSDDGHVLVRQFSPNRRDYLKYYIDGKLVNRLGPYFSHHADFVAQGADGSTALLTYKDESREKPQIVATNSKGALAFRVDCEETDQDPIPAPNATGVLLPGAGATDQRNFLNWYTAKGKSRALQPSPNPHCIGWVPETQKSLFSTSSGHDDRFHMVDWSTGRELWDIPCPGGGHALSVMVTSRLVLFVVAELYDARWVNGGGWAFTHDHPLEWIRDFYAVQIDDGHIIARWRAHNVLPVLNEPELFEPERFMRQGKKLYFVTPNKFTEIVEDDIFAHKSGWQEITDPRK